MDFGGVLTTSIWPAFAAFCADEGLEPDAVRELFRTEPAALADLRQLEVGELEPGAFEPRFAAHLGLSEDRAPGLIDRLFSGMGPEVRMVEAVQAARETGIKTGLISNSWGTTIYSPEVIDGLFDVSIISGQVGLHKPQPEIYRLACDRLEVEPSDCVFVDDLRENCAGAEAVGMTAVLHREPGDTVARLSELLGVDL